MTAMWWLTALLAVGLVTTDNPWGHQLYDAIRLVTKRFSGIVGDIAHQARNSYHNGRILCIAGYSTFFAQDRLGDPVMASGIDVSFGPADMITSTARLIVAMRAKDPRVAGVREVNGTVDGVRTVNYDVTIGGQNYQPDSTHMWHDHLGLWRAIFTMAATAPIAAAGIASVINGESLQSWLTRTGTTTSTTNPTAPLRPTTPEIDMRTTLYWSGNPSDSRQRVQWPLAETDVVLRFTNVEPASVAIRTATGKRIVGGEIRDGWEFAQLAPGAKAFTIDPRQIQGLAVDLRTRDGLPHADVGVSVGPK